MDKSQPFSRLERVAGWFMLVLILGTAISYSVLGVHDVSNVLLAGSAVTVMSFGPGLWRNEGR